MVEATPNDIPTIQWNELVATEKDHNIIMHIERHEEKWVITYFDNLNIP
ncbi:MAG: hypothetical protein ACUVQW_03100 [Candidatus Bathycorpusculaceae bacterium]